MICVSPYSYQQQECMQPATAEVKAVLDVTTPFDLQKQHIKRTCRRFIALEKLMFLRVNLKVCEGCGGLWFRAQDLNDVYCATCSTRLRAFPAPRSRRLPGRRRKHHHTTRQHASTGGMQRA